jgi:ankyrin repeat protein
MEIRKKDKKGSTPLHWAAFSGAELALSYILSWDVDVNETDSRGFTPLHLAVKSSEDLRSTRSLRHLLIKGADREVRTIDEGKRPIDIALDLRTPAMKDDIVKLL